MTFSKCLRKTTLRFSFLETNPPFFAFSFRKNFNAMPETDTQKVMDREYMVKRLNNDKSGWYNPARYLKN